jgi:2-dehydropantoate 2-reductase
MRILVLGAGAVGGYFGGRLAEAGADVTFLVRPARATALKDRGLVIESPIGDVRRPVQVAVEETLAGSFDTVLLTAKAYDLDQAIAAIRPAVGPATAILPVVTSTGYTASPSASVPAGSVSGLRRSPEPLRRRGSMRGRATTSFSICGKSSS